jgi:small redox-active disulfide protein 2
MKIMVTIEVLGTGCPNCKRQMSIVETAVKQLGIIAEIKKIEEISQIMERGVMMLPAIMIDGDLKVSGRIADVPEIKKFLSGGA